MEAVDISTTSENVCNLEDSSYDVRFIDDNLAQRWMRCISDSNEGNEFVPLLGRDILSNSGIFSQTIPSFFGT